MEKQKSNLENTQQIHEKMPFDNEKYKALQKAEIQKRIEKFGKLYMEVGGKLFDDNHAARVLPGFVPSVKMEILSELKNDLEVIFAVNAKDIISKKVRGDNGLSYANETLRLASIMTEKHIAVCGIVITFFKENPLVAEFEKTAQQQGYKTFHSFKIADYPNDVDLILSNSGFGKNDYIKTSKNLILVSAPGPSSGKLETCISQIYLDKQHGIEAGYAKYETFPVWNLPLNHLANIAYEMATVDLGDKNIIDPFYKKKYGKDAVNYNRDVEAFPVVSKILNLASGKEIYASPTEMGINCVGLAIADDKAVQEASMKEIERRFSKHQAAKKSGTLNSEAMARSTSILARAKSLFEKL